MSKLMPPIFSNNEEKEYFLKRNIDFSSIQKGIKELMKFFGVIIPGGYNLIGGNINPKYFEIILHNPITGEMKTINKFNQAMIII